MPDQQASPLAGYRHLLRIPVTSAIAGDPTIEKEVVLKLDGFSGLFGPGIICLLRGCIRGASHYLESGTPWLESWPGIWNLAPF